MSTGNQNLALGSKKWFFVALTAFLLGFSLPTSIALINLALVLTLVSLLIVVRDLNQIVTLLKRPLFYLPLLMFLMLLISLLYTDYDFGRAMVGKYKKLLYVFPIALFFLQDKRLAPIALKGFVIGNTIVLAVSLLAWLNWFNVFNIEPANPTVFHLHITQNFFMAITCLVWLAMCFQRQGWQRVAYGLLLLLGLFNILFLVNGRTGYLALAVGLGIWLWLILKNKQRLLLALSAIVLVALVFLVPNKARDRIDEGMDEIHNCVASLNTAEYGCRSSMGFRTEFTLRAVDLIESSPLIGVGAGGFSYYSPAKDFYHVNAHNEYLMQTLQSGLIGLTLFLLWMVCLYRAAFQLSGQAKPFMVAIISIYVAGNFVNSFLLDAFEGYAFMMVAGYLAAEVTRRKLGQSQPDKIA